jgi:hypothetical protein
LLIQCSINIKQQSLAISSSFNYILKDEKKSFDEKSFWFCADSCPWDYFDADLIVRSRYCGLMNCQKNHFW